MLLVRLLGHAFKCKSILSISTIGNKFGRAKRAIEYSWHMNRIAKYVHPPLFFSPQNRAKKEGSLAWRKASLFFSLSPPKRGVDNVADRMEEQSQQKEGRTHTKKVMEQEEEEEERSKYDTCVAR